MGIGTQIITIRSREKGLYELLQYDISSEGYAVRFGNVFKDLQEAIAQAKEIAERDQINYLPLRGEGCLVRSAESGRFRIYSAWRLASHGKLRFIE